MTDITEDQIDRFGRCADRLDAILYSSKIPLPTPQLHIDGLTGVIREVRDEVASLVREISGEDPWKTNPLEG